MQKIPMLSKEELENLLFEQLLSKKQICKRLNISIPTLSSWMKSYNLTGKISLQLQAKKRCKTLEERKIIHEPSLIERTLKGERIIKPGFNSEFIEEYMIAEVEK